jgi:hypothetical protein
VPAESFTQPAEDIMQNRTFTAYGALAENRRVKIKAGTTTTPPQVEYAGAGEQHIGLTSTAAADGHLVAIALRNNPGPWKAIAAEAVAAGATLYGAADGKVQDTAAGSAIGTAISAADADGDEIEFVDIAVSSTTAGTISLADAGGFTEAATVEAALAEIYQHLESPQAQLNLPITSALVAATGAPLAVFADGASATPGVELTNGKAPAVRWNNHATPGAIALAVAMPQDLDDSADVVFHALVSKTGATVGDATKLTVGAFEQTVGALHDADTDFGGDTNAVVGDATAKTVTELTLTLALADIHAPPSALSLTVKPKAGTLGTDDLILHAAWIEYKRKLLTA